MTEPWKDKKRVAEQRSKAFDWKTHRDVAECRCICDTIFFSPAKAFMEPPVVFASKNPCPQCKSYLVLRISVMDTMTIGSNDVGRV